MHLSKISLALRQWGAGGGFSPLSLFASGEQGAWYDPSDLSTMFQDSAGTTPVTADGQPVGLILDKSKGLVLGPELVTNGSFDVGTGWSLTNSTISGGKLVCNAVGSVFLATQSVAFTYPKSYELNVVISGLVSGNCTVVFGVGTNVSSSAMTSNGTYKFIIASGSGNSELRILSSGSGFVGNVDSISVKELAGNHASQATAASRPLYKTSGGLHWLQFDGVDDSLSTSSIDFTSTNKMSVFIGSMNTFGGSAYEICVKFGGINAAGSLYATYHLENRFEIGTSQGYRDYVFSSPSDGVASVNTILLDGALSGESSVLFESSAPNSSGASSLAGSAGYFGNYPLEISPSGFFFGGRIYSMIIRGALSTPQQITDTENWVNGKTGAWA